MDAPPIAGKPAPTAHQLTYQTQLLELQLEAGRQALQLEAARADTERRRMEADALAAESAARSAQARQSTDEPKFLC